MVPVGVAPGLLHHQAVHSMEILKERKKELYKEKAAETGSKGVSS